MRGSVEVLYGSEVVVEAVAEDPPRWSLSFEKGYYQSPRLDCVQGKKNLPVASVTFSGREGRPREDHCLPAWLGPLDEQARSRNGGGGSEACT